MTLKELGELVIWLGAVAGALAAIALVIRFAVVRPLKSWIVEQTLPAREAAEQLKPNHGSSARDLMQATSDRVSSMEQEIRQQKEYSESTRRVADTALSLVQSVAARLDRIDNKLDRMAERGDGAANREQA